MQKRPRMAHFLKMDAKYSVLFDALLQGELIMPNRDHKCAQISCNWRVLCQGRQDETKMTWYKTKRRERPKSHTVCV